MIKTIIFSIVLLAAFAGIVINMSRLVTYLRMGKWTDRFANAPERVKRVLGVAIGQSKILRDPVAGPIHAFIFWGFLVLLFAVLESIGEGFFGTFSFSFLGPVYTAITASQDIFIGLVILSVIASFWRRFVTKVRRLQGDEHEKKDAALILFLIFTIVTSLLIANATRYATGGQYAWEVRPLASMMSAMFDGGASSTHLLYEVMWWIHIVVVLGFMNYLPYSKHLHVITSVPNVYLSDLKRKNYLKPINFEDETITKYGASDVEDLTWKQLLDGQTCTHCGRCTSVCPANTTGKVLDPRWIIIATRERMLDKAPKLVGDKAFGFTSWDPEENLSKTAVAADGSLEAPAESSTELITADPKNASTGGTLLMQKPRLAVEEVDSRKFVGDYIPSEMLWQCTTCQACMQECPVMIEHVDEIIDLRRNLVMMESSFPAELQAAFTSMENNFTPWAFSPYERADWAQGLEIETMEQYASRKAEISTPEVGKKEDIVLFWVGCAGSFDARAKSISRAFSELMQIAGINFKILGNEEKCTGDPARRMGNEYLAQMLIKENVDTLNRYNISKVVTTCPHCFNAIRNEWKDFGGNFDVVHHTEFITDLLAKGLIKPTKELLEKATYHDSCYLGRSNDFYEAPRAALSNIPGLNVVEMPRNQSKGLCCGAGGGQMWMEETEGKRINIERTEEALSTGSSVVASACPFCMTMLSDGVKAKEAGDTVKVKDIAEIVLESVR
ncbi:MAG TPA: heterodisulfide reductase-related iron-sulfur binding cluster [Candidatus Kapabacteria bacterium]|nr:heterodisulfide reductase-related iron-sulfur binding cluster [Candidatus Kapabacteria bacterium]